MRVGVRNLQTIVSGDLTSPVVDGETIICENGKITAIGDVPANELDGCDVVIDANGATAIPGLIDSHVHITFGDFTPRQNTVGYLTSYLHGGTTTSITASEVHVPGRPSDIQGVKALAVAARKCFETYRPGGMRVHAGSIILEPGLQLADLEEISKGRGMARKSRIWRGFCGARLCCVGQSRQKSGNDYNAAHRRSFYSRFVSDHRRGFDGH